MTTTRDLITPEEMARLRRKRPGAQFLAIDLHDMVWWIDPHTCTDIANVIFYKREEFLAALVHSGLLTEYDAWFRHPADGSWCNHGAEDYCLVKHEIVVKGWRLADSTGLSDQNGTIAPAGQSHGPANPTQVLGCQNWGSAAPAPPYKALRAFTPGGDS